jgi:hypothetical protein
MAERPADDSRQDDEPLLDGEDLRCLGMWKADDPFNDIFRRDWHALIDALANSPTPKPPRKPRNAPPDGLRTAHEAAERIGCSAKTLRDHVRSGALRYVLIGHGTRRLRKMFADSDINDFIANQTRKDSPASWPSSKTSARRSGATTSKSEVVAFTARPNARTGGKRKR